MDLVSLEQQIIDRFGIGIFDWTIVRSGIPAKWCWYCGTKPRSGSTNTWKDSGEADTIQEAFLQMLAIPIE